MGLNNGYFGGGSTGSNEVTTVDKLVFATDTTAVQTSAALPAAKMGSSGFSGPIGGYFGGGVSGNNTNLVMTVDKLIFLTDTTSTLASTLSQARKFMAGCNSTTNGYSGGGQIAVQSATTDKTTFSSDTTANIGTLNLSQARWALGGVSGSTAGYFSGGLQTGPLQTFALTDKLVFGTDTTAAQASANLSVSRCNLAGNVQSSTNGYFAGGATLSDVTGQVICDRLVFATDTTAAQTSANLTQATSELAGTASATAGYFAGGNTGAYVVTAFKMPFSTETTATQASANLSQARTFLMSCAGSVTPFTIYLDTGGNLTTNQLIAGAVGTGLSFQIGIP